MSVSCFIADDLTEQGTEINLCIYLGFRIILLIPSDERRASIALITNRGYCVGKGDLSMADVC